MFGSASVFSQTIIFEENFETGVIPFGWLQNNSSSDNWKVDYALNASSQNWSIKENGQFAYTNDDACNCDKSLDQIVTPTMSLSGYSNAYLRLEYFFNEGVYAGNQESAEVLISSDGGVSYTSIGQLTGDANWQIMNIDISAYLNNNVSIAIEYSDNGGWLFGLALAEISVLEINNSDLKMDKIEVDPFYTEDDSIIMKGTITNLGLDSITSYNLTYSYAGNSNNEIFNQTLSSLQSSTFQFTDKISGSIGTNEDLKIWISGVNGTTDNDQTNDSIQAGIHILNEIVEQKPLVEFFSSATCGACVTADEYNHGILVNNGANIEGGLVSSIYYHVDSSANEPGYTMTAKDRYQWYSANTIPSYAVNGRKSGNSNQFDINTLSQTNSGIKLNTNYSVNSNVISINCEIIPLINFENARLKLNAVITEREANIANNGNSMSKYLARTILGNISGIALDTMHLGDTVNILFTDTFSIGNPVVAGSGDYFEGVSNITVVSFLQDSLDQEILQSSILNWPVSVSENTSKNLGFIYPNPAVASFKWSTQSDSPYVIDIYNLNGKLVYQNNNYNSEAIDISDFPSGVYLVNVSQGDFVSYEKLIIAN
jgi:hypothetical protein